MKIHDRKPDTLQERHLPNSVAIRCDCGVDLLWPRGGGDIVRCPACKKTEMLPISETDPHTGKDPHG
jgi:hypothetical protein